MSKSIADLHRKGMKNPEYRRTYAQHDLMSRVALNILKYRTARDMTQSELGVKIGLSQSGVAHLEAGDKNLTLRTLASFADALGVDPAELVAPLEKPAMKTAGKKKRPVAKAYIV